MKVRGTQEIGPIAREAMSALADDRKARVASIARRVKQHTYTWPTSWQIADRILEDASLNAELLAV